MNRRRFLGSTVTVTIPFLTGCVSNGVGEGGNEATVGKNATLNEKTASEDRTTGERTSFPSQTTEEGEGYTPLTDHYFSDTVTYDHDQLRLRALDNAVQPGETIKFKITNTGDSGITLGCQNPTTIQKQVDGQWRDVVWTSANAFLTCATVLPAGESSIEKVTVSRTALAAQGEKVRLELNPGQYRFVLLSTDPYLATDFHIRGKTTK